MDWHNQSQRVCEQHIDAWPANPQGTGSSHYEIRPGSQACLEERCCVMAWTLWQVETNLSLIEQVPLPRPSSEEVLLVVASFLRSSCSQERTRDASHVGPSLPSLPALLSQLPKSQGACLHRQSELTFISYSSMTSETSPINLLVLYFRPRFFVAWLRRPYLTLHENITTSQHR